MISLINLQFAYHINPKNLLYLELGSEQKAGISIYNKKIFTYVQVITFPVSHRRREMYSGHTPKLLHGPGCNLVGPVTAGMQITKLINRFLGDHL